MNNANTSAPDFLGYAAEPTEANQSHTRDPEQIMLWHCNYHKGTRMKLAAYLLCACSLSGVSRAAEWYSPQVGEPHVDFVLPRIDTREAVSLSQFQGKKVLLIQFASW